MASAILKLTLLLSSLAAVATAELSDLRHEMNSHLSGRGNDPAAFISMPIAKVKRSPLSKRQNPISATLGNAVDISEYVINATIGTPGQQITFQLDTGR